MYTYKASLHTGEVFTFESDKELETLLIELNTCSDMYMRFGDRIRQKSAVVGLDLINATETTEWVAVDE